MPLARVLILATMVSSCAAVAQSQQSKPSENPQLADSGSIALADTLADSFRISPYPQSDLGTQLVAVNNQPDRIAPDRIALDQYNPDQPRVSDLPPYRESDAACLRIRSFRVARDNPHSDSTHFESYSDCIPTARFQVYTTVDHPPSKP
jgi:hypothetical protein